MKIIVIGGGAAGMMAAVAAAHRGNDVTLIERNEKLGKKIYITGKGRCNLTNDCAYDVLIKNVLRNPKFMYSAFRAYDNQDIICFMHEHNCSTKVERGGRVFPVSDHASDVIRTLRSALEEAGVRVKLNTLISRIDTDRGRVVSVGDTSGNVYKCDYLIVASGGASYPSTGSNGQTFKLIESLGHTIVPLRPALVPLLSPDPFISDLQGLSLKNVTLSLMRNGKSIYDELGEMLFTHEGISGPLVLSASSIYEEGDSILLDLKPALDPERLDGRLLRDFKEYSNRDFINSLNDLFPKSLIPVMVEMSGIEPDKKVHQITAEERRRFISVIKAFPINISGTAGFDEAVITRGGVDVREIDSSTMRSKKYKNLSFAGEMIDVDAYTGGFNLQIAWSTGYLAGIKANIQMYT